MTTRFLPLLVLAGFSVAAPVAAMASTDHRGTVRVCHEGYVEHGPADHPIAPAYVGDHFTIQRSRYAVVHHSNGSVERFAKGRLTRIDKKSGKHFAYSGWTSTRNLSCG